MLNKINEALDRIYAGKEEIKEEKGKHFDLLMALKGAREALQRNDIYNLKAYEVAYQDAIERYFPDKSWWEVVDFDIFGDLFSNKDPEHTEIEIVKHIKEDEIDESCDECALNEQVDPIVFEIADKIARKIRKEGFLTFGDVDYLSPLHTDRDTFSLSQNFDFAVLAVTVTDKSNHLGSAYIQTYCNFFNILRGFDVLFFA